MNDNTPSDPNDTSFTLNLHNIFSANHFLSLTRMLASDLINNPYGSVGNFIQTISDEELQLLIDITDDEQHPRLNEIMLISEMLATSEGLEPGTIDIFTDRINQFSILVVLESLKRKGLIKLHYNNMSFGDDCKDKIIAEKI